MPNTPTENDDILTGTSGPDTIDGLGGNDSIRGGNGNDDLSGSAGNDFIDGGSGDDQLHGGDDNDYLRGGPGDDFIDGGLGIDRVAYATAPSAVTVDLRIQNLTAQDTGGAGHDTIINVENVSGSFFSDTLYGNDNANWIWALGPTNGVTPTNDNLYGNGGDDLLQAGTGDHILDGGSGIDTVGFGQPGDILYAVPDATGNDGIVINLGIQGVAQNTHQGMMTLISIENVSGSVLDDVLRGSNSANVIAGDAGNDSLFGLGGNDIICGDGAIGIDSGGTGTSGPITTFTADQGIGVDFYDANGHLVFLFGGQPLYDAAGNLLAADVSNDPQDPYTHYNVGGVDYYFYVGSTMPSDGVAGNDVIDGGDGDDMLYGGGGNDLLKGGAGPASGNDLLDGGDGDDYLTGGAGNDTIIGGAGIDRAGYFTNVGGVGVNVDLRIVGVAQNTGSQGMDTISGVENLSGTTFADTLTGNDGDNWLWGSTANFNGIFSSTNNDTIFGHGGNDLIVVGIGNHLLDGGADNDTLRFTENGGIVENGINVSLALQGAAQATGYGSWTLSNFENLSGGQGDDHLIGDGGNNRLTGEGGDDILEGGGGNDILSGDAVYDADTHGLGYSGAARLIFDPDAAPGDDHLDGGAGDDTALFLLAPGTGILSLDHDGADLLVLRGSETIARISFDGSSITVEGLNSAAQLGTDTLFNIEHISFQIDGGGAPLVVDLSGGVVVDGYVAGGTVFADANNNGVLDPGESFTTTDANGNFTLGAGSGPLVMFGGTNVDTGLPNLVTLTAPEGSTVVNPLTTLVQILIEGGATPGDAHDAVASAFGIDPGVDLTSFDPLAIGANTADALAVQQASAAVVVLVLAGADAAGGGEANENAVFDALADAVAVSGAVDLTDSATVTAILTDALPVGTDVSGATQATTDAADDINNATDLAGVAAAQDEALNDPPVVTVPASFAATEQQVLDLKHSLSVSDVDAGSGTVTATLSVGYGILHVDVGTSGASIDSGNDSASVIVTGTVAQINALLDGDATSVIIYFAHTDTPPASTTITFSVDDGGNSGAGGPLTGSDSGTINITAVDDAPVSGGASSASGSEDDFAIAGTVPAASDVDSNALTYGLVAGSVKVDGVAAPDSTIAFDSSGNYSYTPGPADQALGDAQTRIITFDYVANDGSVDSAPATVTVTVNGVNDAPVSGGASSASGSEDDFAIAGTVPAASDVDSNALTYGLVAGSVKVDGVAAPDSTVAFDSSGNYSYAPDPADQALGDAQTRIITFDYVANDGSADTAPSAVTVTINGANDAPVSGGASSASGSEDDVAIAGTVPAASDVDSNALTYGLVAGSVKVDGVAVADSTVAFDSSGNYSYTPGPADQALGDGQTRIVTFDYVANDGSADSAPGTVTVTVNGVNDAPVSGGASSASGSEDDVAIAGVVPTASDVDSNALTYSLVAGSVKVDGVAAPDSTIAFDSSGNYSYTPGPADQALGDGQTRIVTFDYVANDGSVDSAPAAVTVTINGANDAPIISNYDHVIAASGIDPVALRVAAPVDPDGDPLTITIDHVPAYGVVEYFDGTTWVVAGNGASVSAAELATLRYTPPTSGVFGGDSILYSASDGTLTSHGTITIASQDVSVDPVQLLFAASDANGHNPDLYTVDSAGVLHAAAINPPNGSFAGDGSGFVQFGGDSYFIAANAVASFGGLFRIDSAGTASLVDAGGGAYFGTQFGTDPHFTLFAGGLYFAGDVDGEGSVAIRLNADGSHASFDVNGNNQNMAGANGGFVAFDGSLFFSAVTTLTNGNSSPDLIRLDQDGTTTEISTRSAPNAAFGSFAGEDGGFVVFNNALYFNAYDDVLGDTLFRLDAGSTTPVAVDSAGTVFSHTNSGGTDSAFHVFAGSLYFNEYSVATFADSLFKLDAAGNLAEIQYLNSSSTLEDLVGAGAIGGFIDFAGSTWFTASTSETGLDLFRLDDCGCVEAIDVNFGPADAFGSGLVSGFVVFDGALYFDAYDGSGGDSLFRVDDCGCVTLIDLGGAPGSTTQAGVEGGFQEAFGSLFFSAYTGDGYEIVRLEKDGSYSDYDINPGAGGSSVIPGDGQTFGLLNANLLIGTGENDIIAGSGANESLSGGAGNDVLESRGGNDDLTGGDGADIFVLSQSGAANLVNIDDYDFISGDKVDLSGLLDGGFGPNGNVGDFARLFAVGGDIKLQVDLDGAANGANWTDIAILPGGNSPALDTVQVHFNNQDYVLVESFQTNVQTIALAGGGWAVTWTQASYEEGDVYENVFGRVFAADGSQTGGTFQVSATDNGMDDANNLTVALANGDFAIVWQACDNEIWTRVYHADGTPATDPEAVQPADPNVLGVMPGGLIALSNGGYAVLWGQEDPTGDNIYISTFAADGTPGAGPVQVDSTGLQDDELTSNIGAPVAFLEATQILKLDDGFAVTWLSERDTGPAGATETSVFVRVFHNDGTPATGEIQANSADHGVTSADGGTEDFFPVLVALGGNDFAVQWESDAGSTQQIFARIFDDTDYDAGAPLRLDSNNDANVLAETWNASRLANGGFVALWDQYDSSPPRARMRPPTSISRYSTRLGRSWWARRPAGSL